MEKLRYIAICGKDKLERLAVNLAARLEGAEIFDLEDNAGQYKGLWYGINDEAVNLTAIFYEKTITDKNRVVGYYNRLLNTDKFGAYIKKNLTDRIFILLKSMHLLRLSGAGADGILMIKNPIDEFVAGYMKERYGIKHKIRWVYPIWGVVYIALYFKWLVSELARRGIVFNKAREAYKFSKEAIWGFSNVTLRDDILIDNDKIKADDLLLLDFGTKDQYRASALKEARQRGFKVVSIPDLKVNINKNFAGILFFYLLAPIKIYFRSLFSGQSYLFAYISTFHRSSFAIEVFMNLYDVKCHISTRDWGDVDTTIILNKYGTKAAFFLWSDIVVYKAATHVFAAHNMYFAWGDIYFDYYADTFSVDRKISVGCIFKKECARALANKDDIMPRIRGMKKGDKTVTFYDTSFVSNIEYTEHFLLEYLNMVKDFCGMNRQVKVLLKPKAGDYPALLSHTNNIRFEKVWKSLAECENFIYLDPSRWNIGEAIAVSDICIGMGMNSCTTIALVCGKNALYFDNTGNEHHPFAKKYKNTIMFDDKELLFKQIDRILKEEFNCSDFIAEQDIRKFDAFGDDRALERMISNLHELISA